MHYPRRLKLGLYIMGDGEVYIMDDMGNLIAHDDYSFGLFVFSVYSSR